MKGALITPKKIFRYNEPRIYFSRKSIFDYLYVVLYNKTDENPTILGKYTNSKFPKFKNSETFELVIESKAEDVQKIEFIAGNANLLFSTEFKIHINDAAYILSYDKNEMIQYQTDGAHMSVYGVNRLELFDRLFDKAYVELMVKCSTPTTITPTPQTTSTTTTTSPTQQCHFKTYSGTIILINILTLIFVVLGVVIYILDIVEKRQIASRAQDVLI
ncbi:hypothetical protein PvNV_093 [Penaeus vannamei nudivirus]|nr:hypothetical protein PvSNPV_093 [Penaeus vannamei nucleopolyhedrovirus]